MSEIPMPDGEYDVIYADPPWSYKTEDNPRGGVAKHYDTMDIEDICNLQPPAKDDSVLYLWGTVTHVPQAIEVINSWGFEHKSQAVWDKEIIGSGWWFRGQHELLYVATKGSPGTPPESVRRSSVFRKQREGHSEKPAIVREHIEEAWPDADKLELFARDNRVGWEPWGNEVPETEQQTL